MYRDSQHGLTIDLAGPDGNVFVLAGIARTWTAQMGEAKNLMAEAEKRPDCYDYNGVLDIFDEWFPNMVTWLNDPRESENA
jgi:hypothetical protein